MLHLRSAAGEAGAVFWSIHRKANLPISRDLVSRKAAA